MPILIFLLSLFCFWCHLFLFFSVLCPGPILKWHFSVLTNHSKHFYVFFSLLMPRHTVLEPLTRSTLMRHKKINACHSINVILFADISQQKQKNKATLLLNSYIQVFSFWDNWTVSHLATWMKDVSLLYKCNADRALLYFEVKFQ